MVVVVVGGVVEVVDVVVDCVVVVVVVDGVVEVEVVVVCAVLVVSVSLTITTVPQTERNRSD